ncbi:MAG: THUMP domain-containing protein [archaeon]
MKYVAITIKGLEDIAIKEVKEIIKAEAKKIVIGRIQFETKDIKKLIENTRSIIKIYELYEKKKFSTIDEISELVKKKKLKIEKPFKISCHREGEHDFNSQIVEQTIGKEIDGKHDLKNPELIIFADIIDNLFICGLDLTPKLLSKRDYRIKICNQSINACIAYSMVRLSSYKKGKNLLDPFCKDGVIPIEAILYQKGKVYAYDSLFHNIRSTEINAKLAKINKELNLSRTDIEWLDSKFKKEEVDCIVTTIPFPSKHFTEKNAQKIYEQFLYQLEFILKKNAKAVIIGQNLSTFKEMLSSFKIKESREITTGGLKQEIVVFTK